jgi:hypothetical protein
MVQAMQRAGVDMGYRRPQTMDQALYGATPDLTDRHRRRCRSNMVPVQNK